MMELLISWCVTSSILLAVFLLLRGTLFRKLSPRARYALWGVVLLRLLVPFQIPSLSLPAAAAALAPELSTISERPIFPNTLLVRPTNPSVSLDEEDQADLPHSVSTIESHLSEYYHFGGPTLSDGVQVVWGAGAGVVLLAVLAAVVWAVYSLLTKQIGGYGWNVIQTTRRIFGWGILFMIPAAAVMDFRLGLERLSEPSYVGMFLYLGLGACAACFVTWNFAIKTLGPIKTMVYIYLVPVITVVCSVLILHEVVTPMSVGGTLLTLVGLALSQWDSLKQLRGRRGQEASSEKDLEAKP